MIKLTAHSVPKQLTAKKISDAIVKYRGTQKSVWNIKWLKEALLKESSGKCAYCEMPLTVESNYMEVDHFHCKNDFDHLILEWDNLLPSCKHCNGSKGEHNVLTQGAIVDPYVDKPGVHFRLSDSYRYVGKTAEGNLSRIVLGLNDTRRCVAVRCDIGNTVIESLDILLRNCKKSPSPTANDLDDIRRGLLGLLNQADPTKQYAATVATVLKRNSDYKLIRRFLTNHGRWDVYLSSLQKAAWSVAL